MRRGFDGLLAEARKRCPEDALGGHLFVFLGRRRNRVKVIWWSPGGLSLYCKRLEKGCFKLPKLEPGQTTVRLGAADLAMLLDGIDWTRARRQTLYEPPRSLTTGGSTSGSK
jgi:transposase